MDKGTPITIEFIHQQLSHYSKSYFNGTKEESDCKDEGKFYLYTQLHKYCIVVIPERDYLGCVMSTRRSRPGESHNRGRDFPDGSLTLETWSDILLAIATYETEHLTYWADLNKLKEKVFDECCEKVTEDVESITPAFIRFYGTPSGIMPPILPPEPEINFDTCSGGTSQYDELLKRKDLD